VAMEIRVAPSWLVGYLGLLDPSEMKSLLFPF
jgi:hypothetical protein